MWADVDALNLDMVDSTNQALYSLLPSHLPHYDCEMVDSTKTLSYRDIVDSTNQASHTNHVMADSTEIFSVLWLIATAMHCILTAYGLFLAIFCTFAGHCHLQILCG